MRSQFVLYKTSSRLLLLLPDCSIRLEAQAESLRRLSGTHSGQTQWTASSLPPPPNLPPTTTCPAALDSHAVIIESGQDRSPPPHGPLSPVLPPRQLPALDAELDSELIFPHTGISPYLPSPDVECLPALILSTPPEPRSRSCSSDISTRSTWWDN